MKVRGVILGHFLCRAKNWTCRSLLTQDILLRSVTSVYLAMLSASNIYFWQNFIGLMCRKNKDNILAK